MVYQTVKNICKNIKIILPAATLLEKINEIPNFERTVLTKSLKGNSLELFKYGSGKNNVLFYGYPDPGEGIGATGILHLMRSLANGNEQLNKLDLTWLFIPCLNFDDQPDDGKSLNKVQKTKAEEVDWLMHKPRPETTALVDVINKHKPVFTFPMHDEFHCHTEQPVYFPVSKVIPIDLADSIREGVIKAGFEISSEFDHPEMGKGFFEFKDVAGDEMKNCTYSISEKYGLVFICELYDHPNISHQKLVQTQLEAGFKAMEWCVAG